MAYLCVISEDGGVETCKVSLADIVTARGALTTMPTVTSDSTNFVVGTVSRNTLGPEVANGISHPENTLITFTVTALAGISTVGQQATLTVAYDTSTTSGSDIFTVKRSSEPYPANQPAAVAGTTPTTVAADLVVTQTVVATVDGLGVGVILGNTTFADVSSSNDAYLVTMPPTVVGQTVEGVSGTNEYILTPNTGSDDLFMGYDFQETDVTRTIPRNARWEAKCVRDDRWDLTVTGIYTEVTDISPTVQSFLDNQYEVVIPPGYYYLNTPITFPYLSGQVMRGQVRTDVLLGLSTGTNTGRSTRLRYLDSGGTGDPAITLRGGEIDIGNFSLLGATPEDNGESPAGVPDPADPPPAQAAGIGILMSSDGGPGLGTGKVNADGIGIYGFTTGLQFGEEDGDNNNDISTWSRMVFRNCTNCVKSESTAAMEHIFYKCQFRHENTYAFTIDAGGHFTVRDSFVARGLDFFHFTATSATTGVNNRMFICENLKVDAIGADAGTFRLVSTVNACRAEIWFIRPSVGANSPSVVWDEGNIDTDMTLTIVDPAYTHTTVTPFTVSAL